MPIKRRASKSRVPKLPRDLLPMAERLMELQEAHRAAICGGGDQSFYSDGRHEELVTLLPIIHQALGVRPWQDGAIIRTEVERLRGNDRD